MLQWISLFYPLLGCYHLAIGKQSDLALRIPSLDARKPLPPIPTQCETTCNPVITVLMAKCTLAECYCNSDFELGLFSCIVCVGAVTNTTDYSEEQQELDSIIKLCAADGVTLPGVTFPGQGPSASTTQQTTATSLTSLLSLSLTISASLTITNRPTSTSSLTPSPTTSQTSGEKAGVRGAVGAIMSGTIILVCFLITT